MKGEKKRKEGENERKSERHRKRDTDPLCSHGSRCIQSGESIIIFINSIVNTVITTTIMMGIISSLSAPIRDL